MGVRGREQEKPRTSKPPVAAETASPVAAAAGIKPLSANLTARLLSMLIGVPILLFVVFLEGPGDLAIVPCLIGALGCALIGGFEFFRAARHRGYHPSEAIGFPAIILTLYTAWVIAHNGYPAPIPAYLPALFTVCLLALIARQALGGRGHAEPLANIGVTLLGVGYVGWLFSFMVFLRSLPGRIVVPLPFVTLPPTARGAWLVLFVFAVTWSADAGAYFVGRRWGKTPLAPEISPSKTREGAVGGLAGSILMALAWGTWIGIPVIHCLALGLLIGVLGQIGDLCESALKRAFGVKDFGTLLPGHGGILDRFDSVFFAAPVAYWYLLAVVSGQWSVVGGR